MWVVHVHRPFSEETGFRLQRLTCRSTLPGTRSQRLDRGKKILGGIVLGQQLGAFTLVPYGRYLGLTKRQFCDLVKVPGRVIEVCGSVTCWKHRAESCFGP